MNEFYEAAIQKLDAGKDEKCGPYGDLMKKDVCAALKEFCRQDAEFAQAVAQGGSFKDCMAAVVMCIKGKSISDMKAYGAAVEFYFPGAGIDVKMTVNLCAEVDGDSAAESAQQSRSAGPIIDLSAFF